MDFPVPTASEKETTADCIRDLEELREKVIIRLQSIEDEARRRLSGGVGEVGKADSLRRRCEALERENLRLLEDSERQATSWKQNMARFEDDRRLLADAWQRLERERINAAAAPARGQPAPPAAIHPAAPIPEEAPSHHLASADTANPVAESILRQFQALCQDVRRASDMRSSPR